MSCTLHSIYHTCCLLHNPFTFEDESNIVQILHIIELKVGPREEKQEQIIIKNNEFFKSVKKDSKMQFGKNKLIPFIDQEYCMIWYV